MIPTPAILALKDEAVRLAEACSTVPMRNLASIVCGYVDAAQWYGEDEFPMKHVTKLVVAMRRGYRSIPD